MSNVKVVDKITVSGAVKLCVKLGTSGQSDAADYLQIAQYLSDYQDIKRIMEDSAFAQITKAKWIEIKELGTIFKCSLCNEPAKEKTNFCPHCGSYMESEL